MKHLALILFLAPLLSAQIFYPPGTVRRYAGTPTAGDCTASAIGRRAVDYSAIPSAHYKCSQTSSGVYEWEAEGSVGGSGDITGVSVSNGLTGGGTTGAVTVSIAADLERTAAGRWKFYDANGPTTVTIQAGSAQSTSNLLETKDSSGNTHIYISNSGQALKNAAAETLYIEPASGQPIFLHTTGQVRTSGSTAGLLALGSGGTVGVQRSSDNNLGITNGSSTTYWTLGLGGIQSGVTTWNDPSSSGTVASKSILGIAAPTLTASSSTTFTTASTLRIGGAPTASTNVTIGTGYALEVAAGNSYFAGAGTFGGNVTVSLLSASNQVVAGSSSFLGWASRSIMFAPSDGTIRLSNAGQTDFSLLQFGGTTSSFPALKRSSTSLAVRLADDSADAPLTASNVTASADFIGSSTSCLYLGATGTDGSWRFCRSSNDLVVSRRESGSWVAKGTWAP